MRTAYPRRSHPPRRSLCHLPGAPDSWTRLDTSVRVSELARLTREQIDWHNHRLLIYGKDGIYGTKSKRRIVALPTEYVPH
jgi:integrase